MHEIIVIQVQFVQLTAQFNFFYWDFIDRHHDQIKSQGHMNFMLANLDRISPEELKIIRQEAAYWHAKNTANI